MMKALLSRNSERLLSEFDRTIAFKHLIDAKCSGMFSGTPGLQFVQAITFKYSEAAIPAVLMPGCEPESLFDHAIIFRHTAAQECTKPKATFASAVSSSDTSAIIKKNLPNGILVIYDFLDGETCKLLRQYTDLQALSEPGVVDMGNSNMEVIRSMKHESRVTHRAEIDGMACTVLNLFNDICCRRLACFYDVDFEWYERPHILRYSTGGKFGAHTDCDAREPNSTEWVRFLDRDYSIILYLNEEFEGGEIEFCNQNYKIKPKTGMLLAFPSDHRYAHAALPVTSGLRYAIVSWAKIMGSPRVRAIPSEAIYLKQNRSVSKQ